MRCLKFYSPVVLLGVFHTLFAVSCMGQSDSYSPTPGDVASLAAFLQEYAEDDILDPSTSYFDAWVDLNHDDRPEVVVYITGRTWCGSGGCFLLVLRSDGASYKVVSTMTLVRLPVRLTASTSNGWRNLSVRVAGGGIVEPYDAELAFDGIAYPSNPTVEPARPLAPGSVGTILIPSDESTQVGTPLYP